MKLCDADAVEVFELGVTEYVNGCIRTAGFNLGGRPWERGYASATRVDGDYQTWKRRTKVRITLPIHIVAATPAEAEEIHQEITDAVEAGRWVLDVHGDGTSLWDCDEADQEPPRIYPGRCERLVTLSIPAQPRASVGY